MQTASAKLNIRKLSDIDKQIKELEGTDEQIVTINCDLIVHSRGQNVFQDNLIVLEMKKSTGRQRDKERDRDRLECLTKSPNQDVWSYGGKLFPENVCGYGLGVYYEVNFKREEEGRRGMSEKKVIELNQNEDLEG